jgi:rhodanese-related sulfurtransferase
MRAAAAVVLAALLMLMSVRVGPRTPPEVLLAALEKGTAPRILDVRTTKEYAAGHVPGAIHVPYHQLWLRRADLPAGKADPVVVYCSHGPRAGMAKFELWALGYENVAFLQGQMSGWKRRGLPLKTGREP